MNYHQGLVAALIILSLGAAIAVGARVREILVFPRSLNRKLVVYLPSGARLTLDHHNSGKDDIEVLKDAIATIGDNKEPAIALDDSLGRDEAPPYKSFLVVADVLAVATIAFIAFIFTPDRVGGVAYFLIFGASALAWQVIVTLFMVKLWSKPAMRDYGGKPIHEAPEKRDGNDNAA
jgi:hypothetical protein